MYSIVVSYDYNDVRTHGLWIANYLFDNEQDMLNEFFPLAWKLANDFQFPTDSIQKKEYFERLEVAIKNKNIEDILCAFDEGFSSAIINVKDIYKTFPAHGFHY